MVILINGTINAGKTTVAKFLAKKLPNSVVIEVDELDLDKRDIPIDERIQLRLERAIESIHKAEKDFQTIIVPNPISKSDFNFLIKKLNGQTIKAFTLNPSLETVSKNRGNRELSDWERGRIEHHYKIGLHKPEFGSIIDNSDQTPEETVEAILKLL